MYSEPSMEKTKMDFVIVNTTPKVKLRQSIFLENTVELSKHGFIHVKF